MVHKFNNGCLIVTQKVVRTKPILRSEWTNPWGSRQLISIFKRQISLFIHCSWDLHLLYWEKNIKNGSHGTISIFKNYFATVFSVFNKISCIQTDPLSWYVGRVIKVGIKMWQNGRSGRVGSGSGWINWVVGQKRVILNWLKMGSG